MGPDPFSMPSFGSQSGAQNSQALGRAIGQAAPLATQWHGPLVGQAPQQVFNQPSTPKSPGVLSKFTHFIGGVGSEIGHIAGSAASWLGHQAVDMATSIPREATGFRNAIFDNFDINQLQAQTKQNSDTLDRLAQDYKTGKISKSSYQIGLAELNRENNVLLQQHKALDNKINADQQSAYKATIDTASTLVTILTAGFGAGTANIGKEGFTVAEQSASDFLKSKAASSYLSFTEGKIGQIAADSGLFARLTPAAQTAIQKATAEVVANGTTMTSSQIARASAVNLALKYPIFYNMLSSTGQGIYQKLDNKQYGQAVQQLAFNALLLLSGGAIGQALKFGEKVTGSLGTAVFGRSSFIDELSKGIGDGIPSGLFRAIDKLPIEEKASAVQALSSVEATNLGAVAGRDPVAAAWRVLNGMASYEGMSMNNFSHEEALNNMINFAKAQQLADEIAKAKGLGPVTVGRVDARALNTISANLSPAIQDGKDVTHNMWEALKADNPTQAWANNENFDRQIKSLINKYSSPSELDMAIRNIKASFNVEGFPRAEAEKLAKMGYIPIKPVNLEAPFKQGEGILTSKFAENSDFFNKSVAPLPVLSSVGDLLTNMGLSPVSSTSRVYQMFNQNMAESFKQLDFLSTTSYKGVTESDTADNIVKRLSSYARNPDRGIKVNGKTLSPITDLRQLTTKDIMTALDVSSTQAKEVKGVIMDSMLQVPLEVRGLGDKVVDLNYKLNPTAGRYARIQGAARFSWNPFFQAKLSYKTELLSQLEAGGKFPTLGGTNNILSVIFPDKYASIDKARSLLRNAGVFEEKASYGEVISGEAVNDVGVSGANLTHKLLPSQERSIASLVQVQADRVGLSLEDFVKNNLSNVRDTVQMIAQYDRRSEFLNSAMARTLNLAFFPFRFEYKVAAITARSLARTSAMTQLAVINGMYRTHNWLNSPEGMAWYSKNSEVIGLFKYFTPIQTLGEVSQILGMHPDSVGSFGELGGLPFGWIPMALDAEGLTNFGGSYVSPKTGQTLPNYVPVTDKGQLATAIQDFIGSVFTYPGATAGLPSKSTITRNIAMGVTRASTKTDYTKVTPPISPSQQKFSDAVQSANASQPGAVPQNQPISPQSYQGQPGIRVPVLPSPALTTPGKQSKSSSGSSSNKKKKADYRPFLLPGQKTYGQL